MPATETQVYDALMAAWAAAWMATPSVISPNAVFVPSSLPPGSSWMELRFIGGNSTALTQGLDLFPGIRSLEISAYTPPGIGSEIGRQLLDDAVAVYQGQRIAAGTSSLTLQTTSAAMELPAKGWFKLTRRLNFRLI